MRRSMTAARPRARPNFHQPTARRRRRLALYSRVIGSGHQAMLELGCGSGDLTCALVELAQRVVGIDMSSASLRLARQRADALLPPESRQASRICANERSQTGVSRSKLRLRGKHFDDRASPSPGRRHPSARSLARAETRRPLSGLVSQPPWPSSGPPLPSEHDVLSRPYRSG